MTCKYCGVEFEPYRKNQKYCTAKCRDLAVQKRSAIEYEIRCAVCGTAFLSRKNVRFCSPECREKSHEIIKNPNREFTPQTPYYCQKWKLEGMTVQEIATLLRRSTESINAALAVGLTQAERYKLRQYFIRNIAENRWRTADELPHQPDSTE